MRTASAPRKQKQRSAKGTPLSVLGLVGESTPKLIRMISKGLPFSVWESFTAATGISDQTAAQVVQIPLRTLSRRKREGRLRPDESDRLVRLYRLYRQALELCEGDDGAARRWLSSPVLGLGGATPLEYATTEVGSREVESLIGRLEHGIPS